MAAYSELNMDQGADFYSTVNITDDTTGLPINISGYSFASSIRTSYWTANASGNIVCTIIDAANGQVSMTLDGANTSLIWSGRYDFDLIMINPISSSITRVVEGILTVSPSITRPT